MTPTQHPKGTPPTDLDEVVRRSPAVCFVWNALPGWPVAYVTDNVRQFGYKPEEFLSGRRTYASIVHPDDLPVILKEVLRIEEGCDDEFALEYRVVAPSGEIHWVTDHSLARRDAGGRVFCYTGIVFDITARKQTEIELSRTREELMRSLKFTESLLSAVPTPVFFKDIQGRYIGCNRAFSEIMGVASEDIEGKTVYECWPSEHARIYHQHDLELLRAPHLQIYESEVLDRHGNSRAVIYAKDAFRDEKDRVAGIVGAFVDITDIKQMELELRHRLDFERVVMEISTEFVGRRSEHIDESIYAGLRLLGEATGINRTFILELRGAARMDVTREWCREGVGAQMDLLQSLKVCDFPMAYEQIPPSQVLVAGIDEPEDQPDERARAAADMVRSSLLLPMTVAGQVLGFLGVDAVRSDRPWSEDDMRLLRVTAETLASGLNRRNTDARLSDAQKLESVGRLAAGVAHDLNNMLTPILGFAQLLQPELTGRPQALDDLHEVIRAAERSRDLVRQLLAFSRKQVLDLRPIDLPAVVRDMEKLLRSAIRENIDIRLIAPSDGHRVLADSGQLEQAIMNLTMNAQDAMPYGGTLVIETGEAELDETYLVGHTDVAPGRYAVLTVTDTGSGMDKHTREHAFEPFFTTKKPGSGTGLGLATVYGVVKQHGGSIYLYSEPGKGSTFKIYLPVIDQAAPLDEAAFHKPAGVLPKGTTVAVAEDDAVVRRLVANVLAQAGCTVLAAATAGECLQIVERHEGPIDLLLTDVVMQDLDGRELHDQIVSRFPGRFASIKVLYMSGYTHNVIAHRGVLDEGVHFIQKPFAVERLIEKVAEVLSS